MTGGQLVFLDDSGDPGFKFGRSSSRHFVVACVVFDQKAAAGQVAAAMRAFREERGWHAAYEFKFNKLEKGIVKELLRRVAPFDYRIRAVLVDKTLIRSDEMRSKAESFYSFVIAQVLDRIPGLREADVRLDGQAGSRQRRAAGAYYRRRLNAETKRVARFRFVDSRADNLIQLADLAAGSIFRQAQDKTDAADYVGILSPRIDEIWDFK
ncbi:MAG: DUF3800 domain-containing protein [Bifidobacteriaceae bacterium]|nr:DUF3800 domain-containing protein [Bifidobacteriaceae bacterium]